ncbi:MAG: hypothetical protein AMS27_15205, partial [Bacteroides sp. SM23_62_1]
MNSRSFLVTPALFVLTSLNILYALSPGLPVAGYADYIPVNRLIHETPGHYYSLLLLPPADTLKVKMCTVAQTDESFGIFYDSGGPEGNYSNSENCSFLIHAHCA